MNPNLCRIVLRPRGPFDVLDLSFRMIRARFWPLARMSLVVLLPPWLLCTAVCWWFAGHPALLLLPVVVAPVLQVPFTVLGGRLLFADEVGLREVLSDVVRALPTLLSVWLVGIAAASVTGFVSCFTLVWVVPMALLFSTETAVLERVGPQRGLQRSWRLAFGHAGISLVGTIAFFVLTAWLGAVFEACGQVLFDVILMLGTPFGSLLEGQTTPYALAGMLLAQPLFAVYKLLLYVDVRTRVEGWDIQIALRAAGLPR